MSDDLDEIETPETENHDFKQLREKAKKTDEAMRDAADARRELAFAKAGIDISDERNGYFIAGYKGEMTREAIREAAEKHGFLGTPVETQEPTDERQTIERIQEATDGARPPEPPGEEDELLEMARKNRDLSLEDFNLAQAHFLRSKGYDVTYDGQEWIT
jgi:hypothetical protein